MHLHVLTHKEKLTEEKNLQDKVVVVLDILFATSTITTIMHHQAAAVLPALDEQDARQQAQRLPPGGFLLAGEKNAVSPPDFAPFSPLALSQQPLVGQIIVYATTNGTVALHMASKAAQVYAASLLNAAAMAEWLQQHHADSTILFVCAGSAGNFNLEDFYGAGYLINHLSHLARTHWRMSDIALAASHLAEHWTPLSCLSHSRVGRLVMNRDMTDELAFSARTDVYTVIPRFYEGYIRCADY